MSKRNRYDHEFKVQAVKLALEIGQTKACNELKLPENTIYGWMHAYRQGRLDLGPGTQTPARALTMNEELIELRKQVKEQAKEIRRLKEENEFLEEASAFFAASRRKSARTWECVSLRSRLATARRKANWLFTVGCLMSVGRVSITI